jgi:6-pyruvoyltetrahydropterin/6-carboxytetrahydropterin synthase
MYRLSREVRFAIDLASEQTRPVTGHNGFGGKPPVTGLGQIFYTLTVTVAGRPDPRSGYLVNIKLVDDAVRYRAIPLIKAAVRQAARGDADNAHQRGGGRLVKQVFQTLNRSFEPHELVGVSLALSPFLSLSVEREPDAQSPMTYLRHTFEFAASHRLHNPDLDDEANREVFGKCNNPHGHGHNYQVMVTLKGEPDANGFLIDFYQLEQVVDEAVIQPLDHKHLNIEVPEFQDGPNRLNPSVEFIAKVAYDRLQTALAGHHASLDAVTVWETPKTWCEYRGA